MSSYHLDHLQYLETEAIHVMREVAAEFERPCLLFSGGKDSICLLRLAEKAFRPSEIPMPLLNIDTGHHFPELNDFRDQRAGELGIAMLGRSGVYAAPDNQGNEDDDASLGQFFMRGPMLTIAGGTSASS